LIKLDVLKRVICATFHLCIVNDNGDVYNVDGNKISYSGENGTDPMISFKGRAERSSQFKYLRDSGRYHQWNIDHHGDI
jgi:hypothetical protein